jgi:iron complex transport system permease protein
MIGKKFLTAESDARRTLLFFLLCLVLAAAVALGLACGTVPLTLHEVLQGLQGEGDAQSVRIVNLLRLPRVIVTLFAGADLALAGCLLQGVLQNPLADPGIIGVSAGAGFFAMVLMLVLPEYTALLPLAAFGGALAATAIVFLLSWDKGINPLRMILAGVAVATLFGGAMSGLNVFFADRIQGTVMWMAGGFAGRSWGHVEMLLPYSLVGILGALLCARQLNALQLGEEMAQSLGVRVKLVRTLLIFLAALLAAAAVSVAGMLGFVGLIVPHMLRLFVGADHEFLLPCAALAGGVVVTLADTAARSLFVPLEIPVGIFMSFLGAPFFLYLLRRRMNG